MSTHALHQHLRTGSSESRDSTAIRMQRPYGDQFPPEILLSGGALDAPEELAAGSCVSTTRTSFRGRPVVSQSTTIR